MATVAGPVSPQPKSTRAARDAPIDCPVAIEAHESAPTTETTIGMVSRLMAPLSSTVAPK